MHIFMCEMNVTYHFDNFHHYYLNVLVACKYVILNPVFLVESFIIFNVIYKHITTNYLIT